MNTETAILVTLVVAVLVIALAAVVSDNAVDRVTDAVMGSEGQKGVVECDPTSQDEECPADGSITGNFFEKFGGG